jgi:hypothetical protein
LKCEPAEYEFDAWCKDGPLRVHAGGRKRSTAQDHRHLALASRAHCRAALTREEAKD